MYLLKVTIGLRVTAEEEERGLDLAEHDMHAYETSVEQSAYHLSIK
jgi:Amt family ammonium transporter